jgi:4-hydroxyphenylpyruvate dioxygenase
MNNNLITNFEIDYVEQYVPMAKPLAYWHRHALGFTVEAYKGVENGHPGMASYLLKSNNIRLVFTAAYPSHKHTAPAEVSNFINNHHAGIKRIVFRTSSVEKAFSQALHNGAIPVQFPVRQSDEQGYVEQAAIRLYEHSEIVFLDRSHYNGVFLPGYKQVMTGNSNADQLFDDIDHIAAELRMNEINFWTEYIHKTIGTSMVQQITRSADNKTGMLLNISQSPRKELTMVMAEPEAANGKSKVQQNIDNYGPGIHHLAFSTKDIIATVKKLKEQDVELVSFPDSYYELLRADPALSHFDIDELQQQGILVDREDNTFLLQKFVKPYGDRPFFIYEIVQRINGYNGFALKNINVLKKAEEMEVMKAAVVEAD